MAHIISKCLMTSHNVSYCLITHISKCLQIPPNISKCLITSQKAHIVKKFSCTFWQNQYWVCYSTHRTTSSCSSPIKLHYCTLYPMKKCWSHFSVPHCMIQICNHHGATRSYNAQSHQNWILWITEGMQSYRVACQGKQQALNQGMQEYVIDPCRALM